MLIETVKPVRREPIKIHAFMFTEEVTEYDLQHWLWGFEDLSCMSVRPMSRHSADNPDHRFNIMNRGFPGWGLFVEPGQWVVYDDGKLYSMDPKDFEGQYLIDEGNAKHKPTKTEK